MNFKDLMIEIQSIRYHIGRCIDGDDEMNLNELWQWLATLVGEEE